MAADETTASPNVRQEFRANTAGPGSLIADLRKNSDVENRSDPCSESCANAGKRAWA